MAEFETPPDERAHDVLAADEFAVPAADPALRHEPVVLPEDPSGIEEPHDVLAAEEFAMPATRRAGPGVTLARHTASLWQLVVAAVAGVMLALLLSRLRRRGV